MLDRPRPAGTVLGEVLPAWPEVVGLEYEPWDQDRIVIDTAGATVEQSLAILHARVPLRSEN